ncbi:hypothetical protein D3C78_1638670 [compost metagenome]
MSMGSGRTVILVEQALRVGMARHPDRIAEAQQKACRCALLVRRQTQAQLGTDRRIFDPVVD